MRPKRIWIQVKVRCQYAPRFVPRNMTNPTDKVCLCAAGCAWFFRALSTYRFIIFVNLGNYRVSADSVESDGDQRQEEHGGGGPDPHGCAGLAV